MVARERPRDRRNPATAARHVVEAYRRGGYVRVQDLGRLKRERHAGSYRKGEEVRLTAGTLRELAGLRRALVVLGFRVGKPFLKYKRYCQPIYGRDQVARFRTLLEQWA